MDWIEYESSKEENSHVPIEKWGQDHWSTFAYLESRAVNYRGEIDNRNMRCNNKLHRSFAHHHAPSNKEYPTRLKDSELQNHDDWSCLEDMVAENLIRAWFYRPMGEPFGGKAKIMLTDKGLLLAGLLRSHKAKGGKWATFTPELV